MVDRIDLLIAVVGIVAAVIGSSAPLWMALAKKADKEDLTRLEARMDARFDAFDAKLDALETRFDAKLDAKVDGVEARLGASINRVEGKLDALILRFVPEQIPPPGELGSGRG